MKLTILLYSLGAGGAERITSLLLEELCKEYEITLVLLEDILHYPLPKEVKKIILGKNKMQENGIKKLLKIPFLAYKYSKILKDSTHSLSLMNRPNYINILASFLAKKPKIFISERSFPSEQYGYKNLNSKINKFLIKTLYPFAYKISANSPQTLQDLQENFKIHEKKLTFLPNLFNLTKIEQLSKENTQEKNLVLQKKKEGKFIFLNIGRLDCGKNHALLIESFSKLKQKDKAHLFIIGAGELKNKLEEQISTLGLKNHISLLGALKNPYAPLSCADCFVFASNHEGFPNVLVESLALGVPIITTDCAPKMILECKEDFLQSSKISKCGITVPLGDTLQMYMAMDKVMQEPLFIQENIKESAKRFSLPHLLPLYKQWLEINL
ncbi:glycosyl transferase [Helicobacter valdiviensis]|uniref:Glycosyl transferase n=1 Tax=Helicobacter valdiviensis TaxID=1458358 RepID=A0A2W6MV68_9HELI|nr:glycosyltransferase [Helicobacter valdiviensis]PZT48425.1 glycosyl transferase [Helicobacter valdiviensis]